MCEAGQSVEALIAIHPTKYAPMLDFFSATETMPQKCIECVLYLLELLDGTLVDTSALVDQVCRCL